MILNKKNFSLKKPSIMGICNITLDSFSDGGKNYKTEDALKNISKMHKEGAKIIDIGAESTRPGSNPITYLDEIKRLEPILKKIPKNKFVISVDTNKIETQEFVLEMGAHIINDVLGGSKDLFYLTSKYKNGLVLTHTPSKPKNMQRKTNTYNNFVTHSEFRPYITKVGLYNDFNELIAIGQLSHPIKNDNDLSLAINVRFDA